MKGKTKIHEYDHLKIEKQVQKDWNTNTIYKTDQNSKKPPYYILDMFPYPSGAGLHVGHPRGYIGSDVYARFKRMQGFNVLHPMGFDAFGLPAEQYAIQTGKHPSVITNQAIKRYKKQLEIIGFSYDWSREIQTIDPEYYKWTQVIFLKIYNSFYDTKKSKARHIDELISIFQKEGNGKVNDYTVHDEVDVFSKTDWKNFSPKEKQDMLMKYRLAYEGHAEVNWCKELGTVLANDEVLEKDGKLVSERGDFPVEKKLMRQWFMRISAYGDRLISGLDVVDFPESTKETQRNWIGKSEGSEIDFPVVASRTTTRDGEFTIWMPDQVRHDNTLGSIKVFTTRADTLFGVTYVVLAPEHPLVVALMPHVENREEVELFVQAQQKKTTEERQDTKEKIGIQLHGVTAINPANKEEIPVWIANYVLMNYGTGAVMAVPAHDERDFEFAQKYNLPIKQVVMPEMGVKRTNEIYRRGVNCVVFDPSTQKYGCAKWSHGQRTWFGGGVDEGEDVFTSARRELEEESGFINIKYAEHFGTARTHFINVAKKLNRVADIDNFLFVLNDLSMGKIAKMEHETFTTDWCDASDLLKEWSVDENNLGSEHSVYFLKQSVNKAVELGFDTKNINFTKNEFNSGYGILVNSDHFNGLTSEQAKKEITKFVGGKLVTKYKMRDAIFARQRYWGEPIPLIHDKKTGLIKEVPVSKLPLKLPNVKSYKPSGTGESPLASVKSWVDAGYETNTMPGWAGSSWYFLRYLDPKNKKKLVDEKILKYWSQPHPSPLLTRRGENTKTGLVDMYVGGSEHNTGHLLYVRFWNKVLFDLGLVKTDEPFQALRHQGMIGGADGRKMSKRWGNVVNPDDVVKTYGADTLRVFEMFLGPFGAHLPWSEDGILGSRRFIERVWRLGRKILDESTPSPRQERAGVRLKENTQSYERILHKTIKKVTEDIESFNFNTAVSAMMICLNEMEKQETIDVKDFKLFLQILAPFASHMTEILWQSYGEKNSIHLSPWPTYDPKLIVDTQITLGVQVNGKVRGEVTLAVNADQKTVEALVAQNENVQKYITGPIKKFIYIPGKIISIVI